MTLASFSGIDLIVPAVPHVSPSDGGHLVVRPARHVSSRIELGAAEVDAMHVLSCVAALALLRTGFAQWHNFQENGNWSSPATCHCHLHVYGRAVRGVDQLWSEALVFPLQADRPVWKVTPWTADQVAVVSKAVDEQLSDPRWSHMLRH